MICGDCRKKLFLFRSAIGCCRRRKDCSQQRLAELVGISRQHLAAVEGAGMHRSISRELLFHIPAALEVEPSQLLKFRPDK